jgi:hypothetical protein
LSPLPDFWRNSGFSLLQRDAAGRLRVTDDYLRAYYLRPEVHPVEESCDDERRLHAALMEQPRREVAASELEAIRDADARDNYRLVLRFRDRLLQAGTVEGCYLGLFRGKIDVPPLFLDQMAHVVLRNILERAEDPLALRAAEIFFREQKATIRDGHVLLADHETVEMHASGSNFGSLGRLIVEAQGATAKADLDVLDRSNAALYWERESRHDTVISLTYGRPALDAFCRVMQDWIGHFLSIGVRVEPVRKIEEARWAWHIGLDAEATALMNALWAGEQVDAGGMRRLLSLFRLQFDKPEEMRGDVAGRSVYLAIACDENDVVRMKPQNLLLNLPLHEA